MRKFTVVVTRTDEYEIEVDDTIYNDAWRADFKKSFWPVSGPRDVACNLAGHQARHGSGDSFIEGYGEVTRDGKLPYSPADFDKKGKLLPEDKRRQAVPGLNIIIVDEDNDIEFDVTEIK